MYLYISTIDKTIILRLFDAAGKLINQKLWQTNVNHSKELLPSLEVFLIDNGQSKNDLRGIVVFRGPGSYTGLRVGMATANMLAMALNIPLIGVEREPVETLNGQILGCLEEQKNFLKPVLPLYPAEPHITRRKN